MSASDIATTFCILVVFVGFLIVIGRSIKRSDGVEPERSLWYYVHAQEEISGE